jgi:hypothetical protein
MDFNSMLADAKLPERTVNICLRGDLVADYEALQVELVKLHGQASDSLAGNGAASVAERMDQLAAQMQEHTYLFRLRAMPRHAWRTLVNAHPPREKDDKVVPEDMISGVNRETFFEPMVRASIIDPDLTDESWKRLLDALTDRQFEDLVSAAWDLNQGKVDVPFLRAASLIRRSSDGE